jgi:hypothetical protein
VAEWLRRWIANPLLYERVSSNLTVVETFGLQSNTVLRTRTAASPTMHRGIEFKICSVLNLAVPTYDNRSSLNVLVRIFMVKDNDFT